MFIDSCLASCLFLSFFRRRLKSNVVRTYLPIVLHYNALQPFNAIRHVGIGACELVECGVDALRSLFTQHPNSNPPDVDEIDHMIFHHVKLWRHCGPRKCSAVVVEELINVILYG